MLSRIMWDLDPDTRRQVEMLRRRKGGHVMPIAATIAVFFGWMFVFGNTWDWMENHRVDPSAWLETRVGTIAMWIIMLVGGYGIAILLAMGAYRLFEAPSLRDALDRYRDRLRCPNCEYDLAGLAGQQGEGLSCPECGETFRLANVRARGLRIIRDHG